MARLTAIARVAPNPLAPYISTVTFVIGSVGMIRAKTTRASASGSRRHLSAPVRSAPVVSLAGARIKNPGSDAAVLYITIRSHETDAL